MRILVTGASGKLGCYLLQHLAGTDDVVAWTQGTRGEILGCSLTPVELTSARAVETAFEKSHPEVIIHTAAVTAVADCFLNPRLAHAVNAEGSRLLAELADGHDAQLIYVSTDMVFDGHEGWYTENATAKPVSTYGRSKLAGEQAVVAFRQHAVVRVSWMFGTALHQRKSFYDSMLRSIKHNEPMRLFDDEWRTPLSLRTAAVELSRLAHSSLCGIFHLGGRERMSRFEMGRRLAKFLGGDENTVQAGKRSDVNFDEPRQADLSLDSTLWRQTFPAAQFPTWEEELKREEGRPRERDEG
jgi:dTDP-4-dehydrorhamnose reductase